MSRSETKTVDYDARSYGDDVSSEWLSKVARDIRITDPDIRFAALMMGATAYWPTKLVRVEDRTISDKADLTQEQVSQAIDILVELNYARRNGTSKDGRTELRLIIPRIAGGKSNGGVRR